nr:cyclic nucleotide-gated cation channel beta-3 isoform X2 [Parasteatoda tepidariorum]
MGILSEQFTDLSQKDMPGLQENRSPLIDAFIDETTEVVSRSRFVSNDTSDDSTTSLEQREFNHPHVPSNNSSEGSVKSCFINRGFESDESAEVLTEGILKNSVPSLNAAGHSNAHNISHNMSTDEINQQTVQTLSLPEEQQWLETDRNTFITKRIQDIVQSFHYRTEKAKEKLVQPPTPSPSPPPETSSEYEMTPINKPRLRLQSLIEDDKISADLHSLSMKILCCTIKKKFIPVFPTIIDPQSKLYISWLFLVMVSYSYNAWSIILLSVFPYQTAENKPIFLAFDYIADIIYLLDIALFKVRLQFLHDGFWVEDYQRTKKNYFKKREFKLDLFALLPLDLCYFIYGVNPLFRLPRLLKVQTFWEFFNRVDAVTKTPYVIRIIRTLMYMMYLIHLNACAYYAMSLWEGIGSNKWVFQGVGNAYIRCFYFATKTATSIGKNPKPENEIEYIFMTISWLMGVFIFAFLVGQIRDIVATATQGRTQYRQLMDQTVMYMRNLNLPDELQRRVRMWLNHNWEQQKTFDVSKILDTLPRKMKTDIAINVHYKTLVKVQLFKDCDKALLRDLVLQLKPVLFLPGDYICKKGEVGKEMYIVNKGMVEVLGGDKGELVLATLTKGSVFGEISLLGIPGCNRRTADVRSKGFSNLFVLGKDDLWEALKNYPEAQKVLRKKAKNIIKENEARVKSNKSPEEEPAIQNEQVKQEDAPTSTPKLVRTVLQMLPKSAHRVQPQANPSATGLFLNNTDDTTSKHSTIIKTAENVSIATIENNEVYSKENTPANKSKTRSMSDGNLLRQPAFKKITKEKSSNLLSSQRASSAKSEPCTYFHPNFADDNCNSSRNISNPLRYRKSLSRENSIDFSHRHQRSFDHLNLTSEENFQSFAFRNQYGERYFKDDSFDNSSEVCSTSTQKLAMDNSDEDNSYLCWTSSSSSIPYLGELFQQGSTETHISTKRSSLEASTSKIRKESIVNPDLLNNTASDHSSSSSIPCLSHFFQSDNSSQSSSNKDIPLSPIIRHETINTIHRPGSSTSNSSSVGYDNLGYVPASILSRRSSILSDISG